jgi:hypothetical protein
VTVVRVSEIPAIEFVLLGYTRSSKSESSVKSTVTEDEELR